MPPIPATTHTVSAKNVIVVAEAVLARGAVTRAQLADATGLSRPTVSAAVMRLLAEGRLVERGDDEVHGAGRRSALLSWALPDGVVLAIVTGHRHVTVAVSKLDGSAICEARYELPSPDDARAAITWAAQALPELLQTAGAGLDEVVAAGVVVPVPVADNRIVASPFRAGWNDIDVAAEVGRLVHAPVVVENDANAGAVAESRAHRSAQDRAEGHLHVKISSGIGAGIVIGGQVLRGDRGQAGEIGHLVANKDGDLCRCGNRGCLETLASVRSVRHALARVYPPSVDREQLRRLLSEGDGAAQRAMRDAGAAVGAAIAPALAMFGLSHVTVGGLGGLIADDLITGLRQGITPLVHRDLAAHLVVSEGVHQQRSEQVGIVLLAVDAIRAQARPAAPRR